MEFAVHAVPYHHRKRDLIIGHIGEKTEAGK